MRINGTEEIDGSIGSCDGCLAMSMDYSMDVSRRSMSARWVGAPYDVPKHCPFDGWGDACQRVGEFVRINSAGIERINIEAKWAVVHERGSWAAYPDQACGLDGACGLSASASMRRPVQARHVYAHKPVTLDGDERRATRSLRLNPMRDDAVAKPHIDSAVHRGRGVSTCNHAVNRDTPPPATGIYAHKPSGSRHSPPPLSMQREPRCIGSQIPRLIPRSRAARLYAHKHIHSLTRVLRIAHPSRGSHRRGATCPIAAAIHQAHSRSPPDHLRGPRHRLATIPGSTIQA